MGLTVIFNLVQKIFQVKSAQKILPKSVIWHVMQSMPNSSHVLSGLLSSIVTQVRISSISFDQDVKDFLMIKLTCQVQRSVASMRPNVGVGSVLARLKCKQTIEKCKQTAKNRFSHTNNLTRSRFPCLQAQCKAVYPEVKSLALASLGSSRSILNSVV